MRARNLPAIVGVPTVAVLTVAVLTACRNGDQSPAGDSSYITNSSSVATSQASTAASQATTATSRATTATSQSTTETRQSGSTTTGVCSQNVDGICTSTSASIKRTEGSSP